jgi:hypothetical protein
MSAKLSEGFDSISNTLVTNLPKQTFFYAVPSYDLRLFLNIVCFVRLDVQTEFFIQIFPNLKERGINVKSFNQLHKL